VSRNLALEAVGWPVTLMIWAIGWTYRKDERDSVHEDWRTE